MSNAGRPRTGLKACPHCGSTDRDSNGQCRCRNTFYRVSRSVTKAIAEKARAHYNNVLKTSKGDIEKALAKTREEYPSLVAPKKAATPKKAAKKATTKPKKAATPKPEKADTKPEKADTEPERYVLHIKDDFTDPKPYARKDAAVKNGVRSNEAWEVTYKGKVVAASDELI